MLPNVKAYNGNEKYIFVSYAHKDKERVYPFIAALQKKYNVWFDEGIHYGAEWEDEIAEKVENCSIFIFMVTGNSLISDNCWDELHHARELHKNFLNIMLEKETVLPSRFRLRYGRYQMCNYFTFSSAEAAVEDLEIKCGWFTELDPAKKEKPADKRPAPSAIDSPEDMTEPALGYYEKAVSGDAAAQCNLGWCYYNGQGVPQSYEKAVYWDTKAEEQGDAGAQYNLGRCYESGQGAPKNYEKAVYWYTKSAEQGYARAQCNLGVCYKNGQGVPQSYEKAVYWYTKAAKQGDAAAQYNLGVCYYNGQGVPQSYEKAVYWYTKAVEQGYARAQNNLGWCYESGKGVPKSYEKAVYWYTKAAEQGNETAQHNLGVCYENGQGVPQSYEKAVYWYTKAAEQGNARTQNYLGICYENGRGVPKDLGKAMYWYKKAADQGAEDAKKVMKRLAAQW